MNMNFQPGPGQARVVLFQDKASSFTDYDICTFGKEAINAIPYKANQFFSDIIGESLPLRKVFSQISQVAGADSTVLVLGETGTGKELVARAIHNASPRKKKPMVRINCAALPASLIESELFGHERGSFTGAMERRLGKFEQADGGTIFLDEIGEMPLELQAKLLRVLQEKEIERIGGRSFIHVDVRVIAATNRDLEKEVAEGRFRSDLFYRLNIFPITLPALRERREDIALLVSHFVSLYAGKTGKCIRGVKTSVVRALTEYGWPGNIRELQHLMERSVLQATGEFITAVDLPLPKKPARISREADSFTPRTFDDFQREFILRTIRYCGGRISGDHGAAHALDIPVSTLNSKMKRLGIRKEHCCMD